MIGIDRRAFLSGLGALGAGLLLELAGCGGGFEPTGALPPAVKSLRKEARKLLGAEARNAAALLSAVLEASSEREPRAALAAAVRDDFAAGRTAVLRGWTLARTELLLCARAR